VLRPTTLTQVIKVMAVSSKPAKTAQALAKVSSVFKGRALDGWGLKSGVAGRSILAVGQRDLYAAQLLR
jgi:hypothetical protein